jgi:hypothetical protein
MLLHLDTSETFRTANTLATVIKNASTSSVKKRKIAIKVATIKVRLFFWNLTPIHWYDTFKHIHVDMNEFISKKTMYNTQKNYTQ